MQTIKPLNSNKLILIDDADFDEVSIEGWSVSYRNDKPIAIRCYLPGKICLQISRFILKYKGNLEIDHIDRNIFNNQKENYRFSTHANNVLNQGVREDSTSGYKGVNWSKRNKKFIVRIQVNSVRIEIGRYSCKHEAALAYNKAAMLYHGEFAYLNEIKR